MYIYVYISVFKPENFKLEQVPVRSFMSSLIGTYCPRKLLTN